MLLAHLSDLHMLPKGALKPSLLFNRRIFGATNLYIRDWTKKAVHVVKSAMTAISKANVDHIIVTGDLTNLAIEAEFEFASSVIESFGLDHTKLSIIPGNHDYYVPAAAINRRFEHYFGKYTWGPDFDPFAQYPAVKDIDNIRLILACTPTIPPPMFSYGELGTPQMDRIFQLADNAHGRHVVLAIHHHLHNQNFLRDKTGLLRDRQQLKARLAQSSIRLVIHGHDHHEHEMVLQSKLPSGTHVLSCGSTTYQSASKSRFGRFNIYEFKENGALEVERWQSNQSGEFYLLKSP